MSRTTGRGRIARAAISAALTGAMALGGVVGPVATAFAAPTITIKDDSGQPVKTYTKYVMLFSAATIDNTQNAAGAKAEGVAWNDTVKNDVIDFLKGEATTTDASQSYIDWLKGKGLVDQNASASSVTVDGEDALSQVFVAPKNVAMYIGEEIGKANEAGETYDTDTINPNVPHVAKGFASKLANALSTHMTTYDYGEGQTIGLGDTSGYFVLAGAESVTPIWLPYDATAEGNVDLWQKTQLPTFQKEGSEDNGKEAKVTDAGMGDTVTFTLTATLPMGEEYKEPVTFLDRLPAGLTLDASSIKITQQVGEGTPSDITSSFNITTTGGTDGDYEYTFKAESRPGGTFDATSAAIILKLTYNVTVNENAGMGNDSLNTNSAKFKYGDDEIATENLASVVTFGLDILKTDDKTEDAAPLAGAKFTLQNADLNSDSSGQYVQADGSMGVTAYAFTTAETTGLLSAQKIDAGYYTVSEVQAPSGYEPVSDFVLQIKPTYDSVTGELTDLDGVLVTWDATAGEENNGAFVDADTNAYVSVTAKDAATGIVTITVKDSTEEIRLPITGMTPSQLGTITGVVLVAAGAFMVLRRRQAEQA